jgi:uncharacterized membrane protein
LTTISKRQNLSGVKIERFVMSAFHALLMFHIGAGAITLISGPVPMLTRKGGRVHRRVGMVYAWSMTIAAFSALALALVLGSARFIGLAALTLFLIFVGVRAIQFRRHHKPSNVDKIACLASGLISVWLFWRGIVRRCHQRFLWLRRDGAVLASMVSTR